MMAEQPAKKYCANPECHKELRDWRKSYCSPECYPPEPAKPPRRKSPADAPNGVTAPANTEPPNGEPDKPKGKSGPANKKRSDELMSAILNDMAQYNLTEAQACAGHSVRAETFSRWKNEPECEGLRERAQCISIKTLVAKFETAPAGEWKKYAWMLERFFRTQFSDPTRIGFQVNQQFNNGNGDGLVWTQEKLDEARQRLEHTRASQKKREVGAQTNAELREIMLEQIAERQRVLDYLDGGGTLDQDEQKQLYDRLEHESDSRQQEPIRTATGRVVGEAGPMAIEDQSRLEPAPGRPQRPQPSPQDHSMRASDMDPLSGVTMPTEPPTPWRDRKPLAGPLSTRQRWLAEERVRKGGEGKRPW